jgi:hypothetical protein
MATTTFFFRAFGIEVSLQARAADRARGAEKSRFRRTGAAKPQAISFATWRRETRHV